MANKIFAAVLALSLFGLVMLTDASARRCPPGTDDNGTNVCVPKPNR